MKIKQNIPSRFDDEIGLLDIVYFFKFHKKLISTLMILGVILGGFFANIYGPVYEGYALISSAKISGNFVVSPKITVIKLNMNSYYSKETFLNCSPYLDKDINYNMSKIVKSSVTKDGDLIKIYMQNKNTTVITDCLNSIIDDIRVIQNTNAKPLIQSKNNELMLLQEQKRDAEEFKNKLNYSLLKELERNSESLNTTLGLLYKNLILSNDLRIKQTKAEIYKLTADLSSEQTQEAKNILPIAITKSFPSVELGALLGLFLGLCLGILIALIKQIKI
jgi:hypothetical protein